MSIFQAKDDNNDARTWMHLYAASKSQCSKQVFFSGEVLNKLQKKRAKVKLIIYMNNNYCMARVQRPTKK